MWANKLNYDRNIYPKENLHPSSGGKKLPKRAKRNVFGRAVNYVIASFICVCLVIGVVLAGAYVFLQGNTGKGSAVVSRIEAGLQQVVGDDFTVELQNADLTFSKDARVVFKSNDVEITRNSDGKILSRIGDVEAKVNLIEAFSGNSSIEIIRFKNAEVNANILGTGRGVFLPTHLDKPFNVIGSTLATFQKNLDDNKFHEFEIENLKIKGRVLGRKQQDPINVHYLSVKPDGNGRFSLYSELETEQSNIKVDSFYDANASEGSAYEFLATGIRLREWFAEPEAKEGILGSDAVVTLSGNIPFKKDHIALNPTLNIKTSANTLRLGRNAIAEVSNLDLNLRLILEKNQIELDPSLIQIGRLNATWIGGIKPYNAKRGYGGSLRFDLIMKKGVFEPTLNNEALIPAAFKIAGLYNVDDRDLLIDRVLLKTKSGEVAGKARMLFDGETPSLRAEGTTDGISIIAIKQFWPFFLADGARDWVHQHFIDGWVQSGTLKADIPPGKIFRIKDGAKIKPEEFNLKLNMKDVAFRPFGEIPPIRQSKGVLEISGMRISSTIKSGKATTDGTNPITIKNGSFVMNDYAAKRKFGETKLSLEGDARSIAKIADRNPLRVMQRMKVSPAQFSGKGYADIVARFPIAKTTQYTQVDWHVLLDLQNAASSKQLGGRKFSNANIVIDATPISAKVIGSANIDGVKSRLNLVEPIGKSGKAKRKRTITAVMDDKARKALGLDLSPVIKGPINVTILQANGGEKYKIDLTKAEVALPWVGWSKGKGIPAKAEFDLKTKDKVFNLNNFKIDGGGFFGSGSLRLTKKGLVSANIKKLKLNDGDNIALTVKLEKGAYNINAAGNSYDARGVLNSLLYQASFKQAEGGRSVNLTANFKEILGFEKRIISNVNLIYQSRNGNLTKLDMRASGPNGSKYDVKAQRNDNQTLFTIGSNNAGNALAFANIYTRMEGGVIDAQLVRNDNGPFFGPVKLQKFTVVNEPRLDKMVSNVRREFSNERGERGKIIPLKTDKRVSFDLAQSKIEKGDGYLKVQDAIIRSNIIGLSLDGLVYNKTDYMSLTGTFMPANSVNLAVSAIPILGRFFANGKDRALIGITYQLKGPRSNPELLVNPLSIVTPGFFNKVFEFQ